MNPELLEKVLSCDRLPTLPAVAARVVSLMNSREVSMKALAETIQHDPALTAKILKTVNSSLFGLRQKCSSINQAIVMLGLSAVKTLALGFTLVAAIDDAVDNQKAFKMAEHWQRALTTAAAARAIANLARLPDPEECFLGGLLQDVGMIAMHLAMGPAYGTVIAPAGNDHRVVTRLELTALELTHADIGALLVSRWGLPESLVMPIRFHERPTAAPGSFQQSCRAVGLGNLAAALFAGAEPKVGVMKFYRQAERWFGLSSEQCDQVLSTVAQQAREVARLLVVPMAGLTDPKEITRAARRQMESMDVVSPPVGATMRLDGPDSEFTDEITGLCTRQRFDQTVVAAFEQAQTTGSPISVAILSIDQLSAIESEHGPDARDTVLICAAARLESAMASAMPLLCRFDHERFVVLMHRLSADRSQALVDEACAAAGREPVALIAARSGAPPTVNITISAGFAAVNPRGAEQFADAGELVLAAEQALVAKPAEPVLKAA